MQQSMLQCGVVGSRATRMAVPKCCSSRTGVPVVHTARFSSFGVRRPSIVRKTTTITNAGKGNAQSRLQDSKQTLEAEAKAAKAAAAEAMQAKEAAKAKCLSVMAEIEEVAKQQQEFVVKAGQIRASLDRASSLTERRQLEDEMLRTQFRVEELAAKLSNLRDSRMTSAFELAVSTEAKAIRAEEVAAAAVRAAEGAQAALAAASIAVPAGKPAKAAASEDKDAFPWPAMLGGVILAAAFVGSVAFTDGGQSAIGGLFHNITHALSHIHVGHAEEPILITVGLLFFSCVCVPLIVKCIPGGNPVLGYLLAGAIVGPSALGIIHEVEHVRHIAELGVVFLLFNIGLELSIEKLMSMAKLVFGMGTTQVVLTTMAIAGFAMAIGGLPGPAAIIMGGSLAMSTTAVAVAVMTEKGEMPQKHGKAAFSVLLLQDLAVVVLLILVPLLGNATGGMAEIGKALGVAAVKAIAAMGAIIGLGRMVVGPLYKFMADFGNAEIFMATTLLVCLATSIFTALCGLSLALGAFLAGLLISETDYAMQVESDIAPYKGLMLGLFFMSVGMEISAKTIAEKFGWIMMTLTVLIVGKLGVVVAAGRMFGLSLVTALRAGLYLAPGGEFAFVAFGQAVAVGLLPQTLCADLFIVTALSMALTPYLGVLGGIIGQQMEKGDLKALQPSESDGDGLHDHVLIMGWDRVGEMIGDLLEQRGIKYVAIDGSSERVLAAKAEGKPVYFGDCASPQVLHHMHAEHAKCAILSLDSPGSTYRAVWSLNKQFPDLKLFARAFNMDHAMNLEKAGATAVVLETLEPSLQLASAVLSELQMPAGEVSNTVDGFRQKQLAELSSPAGSNGVLAGAFA